MAAYRQMVYGVCYRVAGNADDADDLAHEAFVEAFLKLDQLRDPERFGPWLRALALNLCRMWLRGRKLDVEELTEEIPAGQPPERDLLHAMRRGLTRLTAPHRLALVLHYLEGLSYDEVATFLDVPVGTVMSRLHRGRRELKRLVEEMNDEEIPMTPDEDFTREVDAEIAVLLTIFREEPGAAERLSILLAHAPERLARLIAEAEDEETLDNLGLLLHRLGRPAIETALNSALTGAPAARRHAVRLLRGFIARMRQELPGVPPWMATAPFDAYLLTDGIIRSTADAAVKAEVLAELIEVANIGPTSVLLTVTLLGYPRAALPALLARFWKAAELPDRAVNVPALTALARMGTRFVATLLEPLSTGETGWQVVALNGMEAVARSLQSPHGEDWRHAAKWAPIPREQVDAAVLDAAVVRVAVLLDDEHAETRDRAIRVLGLLRRGEHRARLEWLARHDQLSTRVAALRALAEIGAPESVPVFRAVAADGRERTERLASIESLGRLAAVEAVPMLTGLLADPDTQVRQVAAVALGDIGGEEAREAMQASMHAEDKALARTVAKVLHTSPYFRKQRPPDVALQQMDREVKERLVGAGPRPSAVMSLHGAIGILPEVRPHGERELTGYIARACLDYSTTRRQLIMEKLMCRSGGIYELTDIGQAVWRVERFVQEHYLR
ncbi:MAG: sigma-70 family RNA polymerase sigma factor [Armatimonadota bacterium]